MKYVFLYSKYNLYEKTSYKTFPLGGLVPASWNDRLSPEKIFCLWCRVLQPGEPLRHLPRRGQERLRVPAGRLLRVERAEIHQETAQHGSRALGDGQRHGQQSALRHHWTLRGGKRARADRPHQSGAPEKDWLPVCTHRGARPPRR